ncbi:MspI family type II restriction endonuclease [Candidatus Stoquefichus massiliensis]|uniref:MspI family type II restriction endonuclease n=1 Tax=Candidatus Stoquefichus massiliensis TaxID=1470350 RepID=UPI0004817CBB|nr:MspI family type II restriction endonuclease [Candidatus Stoquefichus massiliensis]
MSNNTKNIHGFNGQKSLETLLNQVKEKEYIKYYKYSFKCGYPNKDKQFYFQFLIEFYDKTKWIVQSTTSIRDRINIQQWHSEHLKILNKEITKAFIVYPDNIPKNEDKIAKSYHIKICHNKIHSSIDGVISQTELFNLIEQKALSNSKIGYSKSIIGISFEDRIVQLLNNKENMNIWKTNTTIATGLYYSTFKMIMRKLNLNPKEVDLLQATNKIKDIGKLPSNGSPKTDILLYIHKSNGEKIPITFSCKRSSAEWVTVHQYSAKCFCDILNIRDDQLVNSIYEFQRVGSIKKFGQQNSDYLSQALIPYNRMLELWVYGGINGYGNPNIQWAKYIITYKNNTDQCEMYSINEYIDIINSQNIKGHFNTIFKWTYASGAKGKSIQLKSKVL